MAALAVSEEFDLESCAEYVIEKLARYQRPVFIRLLQGSMQITGTFKHQKVKYREEGWDIEQIKDPVFALVENRYVVLDAALSARVSANSSILG